jgi:hypothetical protein
MVRLGDDLTVVTPICALLPAGAAGPRTRFCTSCSALSGLVPSLKVTVSVSAPSEVFCEDM